MEIARKAAERAVPPKKVGQAAKDKIAERLEAQLKDIESKFFEQFPADDEDTAAVAEQEPTKAEE